MRYILCEGNDAILFGRYLEALATYRHRLPAMVAQFAGDEERFMLGHPRSLHDARLRRVTVTETAGTEIRPSSVGVEMLLEGQQGDRQIRISYRDVARYDVRGKTEQRGWHDSFHGDIYTHEIRVGESQAVVHEILFASGSTIEIECANFEVSDEMLGDRAE